MQEVLRQKESELQQALEDLKKLQATKAREEYKGTQDSSSTQDLQLSKIACDLQKELEMEQLRDSLRKLNEDYKNLQGVSAAQGLQQSKIAHESSGEELKQIKIILEKLTSDHEKLRAAVQETSSRSKEAATPIGSSAELRVDNKKSKGSKSYHTALHVDVQEQPSSALDRVESAVQKNVERQIRTKAMGKEFIHSPRRQIYIGNIAFNATAKDVFDAINDYTTFTVDKVTMPSSGGRHRGYAFATIAWPTEFKANGVDMDTFCEAIYRLNIKGRPIYAKEAHHRTK